jgi:L-alanine-DL-glutamate epimerase-like enolase superfamily enzyme
MAVHRREFLTNALIGGGALALSNQAAMAQAVSRARDTLQNLRITEMKLLRLRFPGKTPRKWNSIIVSGGGQPGMTQLEIHTNEGIVGRSLPNASRLIESYVFPKIQGENPLDIEKLWEKIYRDNRKPVAKGLFIEALGSVDMALWDIMGKVLNLPVYRILGAYKRRIPVYAAGGYYEEGKSIADLVKEMEGYVSEGFQAVKMKVGGSSFQDDVERVKAVREAIGPDVDLLIDANNKWTAYEAIRFGRAVEKYSLFWFEEPVEPDDFEGCAEVRQALDIPIVAGENEFTRYGCRDLIVNKSADILNLDTVKAGGITEYRKIAALASAFHIPVAPHGSPHMAVHLLAATPNALIMETYPAVESQFNPALPLYPVQDGHITVPEAPGLGIDPDPALVEKYRV